MTTATQASPTATATTSPIYYRLSIEISTHHAPDTSDGQPGETFTLADLIATDDATGRRFAYVGPAPCTTHQEALDLMARIFAWERRGDHRLDPTERAEFWAADNARVDREDTTREDTAEAVAVEPEAVSAEVVETPVIVETPVNPGTVTIGGRRPRKVDAGKVRRAKGATAAENYKG